MSGKKWLGLGKVSIGLVLSAVAFLVVLSILPGTSDVEEKTEQSADSEPKPTVSTQRGDTVQMSVSWVGTYDDVGEVLRGHSLAILGQVLDSVLMDGEELFTHHRVRVLEVVKDEGRSISVGDILTVSQVGGVVLSVNGEEALHGLQDSPPLRKGEICLLFLNGPVVQPTVSEEAVYVGITPWTRLVIEDGTVNWVGGIYQDVRIPCPAGFRTIVGKPVADAISYLRQIE